MKIKSDNKCSFCNEEKETIKHLFWDCEYVQYFWETLVLLLEDNCNFENLILNTSDILFGNSKFDEILNKTILWGKKHIFRAKSEGNLPSFNAFLRLITSHYKTEAYMANLVQNYCGFRTKWQKYIPLFNPSS